MYLKMKILHSEQSLRVVLHVLVDEGGDEVVAVVVAVLRVVGRLVDKESFR